ncbi:13805_t:CDS:2 [Funneliformis caledonium]|uniref:13805_t:CDS:1 n=1 Tax=Funneliformis caledonium TaxID=1117310 RepID=A0A9N9FRB3_9GLOM|nr:13805_t:CDS:2 [Funneliformis caledonium]
MLNGGRSPPQTANSSFYTKRVKIRNYCQTNNRIVEVDQDGNEDGITPYSPQTRKELSIDYKDPKQLDSNLSIEKASKKQLEQIHTKAKKEFENKVKSYTQRYEELAFAKTTMEQEFLESVIKTYKHRNEEFALQKRNMEQEFDKEKRIIEQEFVKEKEITRGISII